MLRPLTWWQRVALAGRILTGRATAVRHVADRWPDGCSVRRIEVLRITHR